MDRSKERLLELVELCNLHLYNGYVELYDFKLHPNAYTSYYDINSGILYEAIMEYGSMPHDLIVPIRIDKTVFKEGSVGYNKIFDYILNRCRTYIKVAEDLDRNIDRDIDYHLKMADELKNKAKSYDYIRIKLEEYKD